MYVYLQKNLSRPKIKDMPRPSLPPALKCLRTYDAKTTQTTDEELWDHFTEEFAKFEKIAYENTALLDKAAAEFYGMNNPYSECSWRHKTPDRLYQTPFEWLCRSDKDFDLVDNHFYMLKLFGDLKVCLKHLDWEKNTDYCDKVTEMLEIGEKYQNEIKAGIEELKILEERKYDLAKKAWLKKNPGIEENRNMKARHEYHHTEKEWREIFEKDPDCAKWYDYKIPTHDDCYWCKRRYEETENYKAELVQKKKDLDKAKAEAEDGVVDDPPEPFETELGDYECEACKFHTQYRAVYSMHLQSPNHLAIQKQKSLLCDRCNIQCRTLIEFNQHLTTKKHKNAENPDAITPQMFSCEPCGYTSTFKGNFENHLKSKRHSEKKATAATKA